MNINFKNFKRIIVFITIATCIVLSTMGGSVFAASKSKSKMVYTSVFNNLAKQSRDSMKKLPVIEEKTGKSSYSKTSTNDGKKETYAYEVYFQGEKYFIKTNAFKAIFDEENEEVYIKKIEKGKEVGDTLALRKESENDWFFYIPSNISRKLRNYTYDNDLFTEAIQDFGIYPEDFEEQRKQLELNAIIFETIASNLKESYFVDPKDGTTKVYTLSMNNGQMTEFCENIIRSLAKNERFLEIIEADDLTNEDVEDTISELKEAFSEVDDFNITMSIYTMNLLEDFVGVKFSMIGSVNDKKESIIVDFNSDGTKPLKSLERLTGSISANSGSYKLETKFEFTKKLIKVTGMNYYEVPNFSFDDNNKFEITYDTTKNEYEFTVNTEDGKEFTESNNIVANLTLNSNGTLHNANMTLKGNSNKSMLDSSEITLNAKVDNEVYNDVIKLYTKDKKAFVESSNIVLEMNIENEKISLILEAKDNKAITDSSKLSLSATANNDSIELITLTANDKKSVLTTKDVTAVISKELTYDEPITIRIKAKDNKPFKETSNLEISYKGKFDYSDCDVVITLKGNTNLLKSKKIDFTIKGIYREDIKIDVSGKLESKDKKALIESLNGKVSLKMLVYDDYNKVKGNLDSEKGYYMEYENVTEKTKEIRELVYQRVDFNKLMDTSKSIKATEPDILAVINS